MKTFTTTTPLARTDKLTLTVLQEPALFFDIETTGFSPKKHHVYLIGCAFWKDSLVTVCQYFAETPDQEAAVLQAFFRLAASFSTTVSFHGLGFDVPFLTERCRRHGLCAFLPEVEHMDLLRLASPYQRILKLENRKQKTLERFLGLTREDAFSGGELIAVYQSYCSDPQKEALSLLTLHNYEDVLGMINLLPLLSYEKLFQGGFAVSGWEENSYREYGYPVPDNPKPGNLEPSTQESRELIFSLVPVHPLPRRISYGQDSVYLTGSGTNIRLRVKILQGELKYFYPNYRDYYYLPQEDMAIHKSVAAYVDKEFRTQAKAATCYSKKSGRFLPLYNDHFSPSFRLDYHDKQAYIEMEHVLSQNLQLDYAIHLLQFLIKGN